MIFEDDNYYAKIDVEFMKILLSNSMDLEIKL